MAQICEQHNLALAADGKCVLCRRAERPAVLVSRRVETTGDRVITVALLLCMVAATGSLVWLLQQPAPDASRVAAAGAVDLAHDEDVDPEPQPAASLGDSGLGDGGLAPSAPRLASADEVEAVMDAQLARTRHKRIDEARAQVQVTMYSTQWCSICDAARFYLDAARVDFVEARIDVDEGAAKRLAKLNKAKTVPTFSVNGEVLVGYNAYEIEAKITAAARAAAGVDEAAPNANNANNAKDTQASKKASKKPSKKPAKNPAKNPAP